MTTFMLECVQTKGNDDVLTVGTIYRGLDYDLQDKTVSVDIPDDDNEDDYDEELWFDMDYFTPVGNTAREIYEQAKDQKNAPAKKLTKANGELYVNTSESVDVAVLMTVRCAFSPSDCPETPYNDGDFTIGRSYYVLGRDSTTVDGNKEPDLLIVDNDCEEMWELARFFEPVDDAAHKWYADNNVEIGHFPNDEDEDED